MLLNARHPQINPAGDYPGMRQGQRRDLYQARGCRERSRSIFRVVRKRSTPSSPWVDMPSDTIVIVDRTLRQRSPQPLAVSLICAESRAAQGNAVRDGW